MFWCFGRVFDDLWRFMMVLKLVDGWIFVWGRNCSWRNRGKLGDVLDWLCWWIFWDFWKRFWLKIAFYYCIKVQTQTYSSFFKKTTKKINFRAVVCWITIIYIVFLWVLCCDLFLHLFQAVRHNNINAFPGRSPIGQGAFHFLPRAGRAGVVDKAWEKDAQEKEGGTGGDTDDEPFTSQINYKF